MATATATASKAAANAKLGQSRAQVSQLQTFQWVGIDKRGVKIKGEYASKNATLVKAELRRQGINPQSVKAKGKPLFGSAGKAIKASDLDGSYFGNVEEAHLIIGGASHDLKNSAGVRLKGGALSFGMGVFVGFEWLDLSLKK